MLNEVLDFWFSELSPAQWFAKDEELDKEISARFLQLHTSASHCELVHWRRSAEGRLAEIIVLDQFSRNIFRDTPQAFSQDPLALVLAQEAISLGCDNLLSDQQKAFLYMPYMHSESKFIHELAVELFSKEGLEGNLDFELKHKVIIDKFGRYPHRNEILARESTAEEIEFLKLPNSGF